MKLNLSNAKTENSIQNKVKNILALNNEGNETEGNNKTMKLNLSNKPENKLQLKKTESIMQNDLTIDKFDRIEKLSSSINSIESTFIEFLKSQNESILTINTFNKKIDNLEILVLNSIKNQKSILDGVNSFHSIMMKLQNKVNEKIETENNFIPEKQIETKLRKASEKEIDPIDSSPENIYNAFMEIFNGNFKGTKELTELESFIPFIESIDFESIKSITESYEKYFSVYLKENNNKQLIARKSKSKAINSLIELAKKLGLEIETSLNGTDLNSVPIDKAYFANLFNSDILTIDELIKESIEYGSIDKNLIDNISTFLKGIKPDTSDNSIGQFVNYIKTYIDKS